MAHTVGLKVKKAKGRGQPSPQTPPQTPVQTDNGGAGQPENKG